MAEKEQVKGTKQKQTKGTKQDKKEQGVIALTKERQIEFLQRAKIAFNDEEQAKYLAQEDDLGKALDTEDTNKIPTGYKRCGKCKHVLKLALFNKNSSSLLGVTGNCKACQKASAKKSYKKTRQKRRSKERYQNNKDYKREWARRYYKEHKDLCKERHENYLKTPKGKKVMAKARVRRSELKAANKGIPYTKELILDRDSTFIGLEKPICLLCGRPIEDLSGQETHIDHIIGITCGGVDGFDNVHLVHKTCNLTRAKDLRDLETNIVETIQKRTEEYISKYPEKFE